MKTGGKQALTLLLAAALLLGLAACGKEAEEEKEPDRYGGVRYVPEFHTLDTDVEEFQSGCVMGDYVYLAGSAVTNEDYNDRESRLLRIPLEGGEVEPLPGCEPPSGDRNVMSSAECLAIAAGEEETLWMLETVRRWYYAFPEDFDPYDMSSGTRGQYYISSEGSYVLRRLDGDGSELFRQEWPIKELESQLGLDFVSEIFIGAGGDVTFCDRSMSCQMVTMDKTGALLGRVNPKDTGLEWQGEVRLGDGRLAVWGLCQENGEYRAGLQALSLKGDTWEDSWTLPAWSTVYSGDANTLFYYNAGSDLLAWKAPASAEEEETAENTPLLSWVNTGLDGGGERVLTEFLPDGRLVIVQGGGIWSEGEPAELVVLTPTDDPPEKTVITLGTPELFSSMEKAVRDFNRTNPDYQIEVREYMDYSEGYDREAAMTRLATEVGAGKIPDILDTYGMPLAGWASSGILEDLWPWIDLDRDIDREDLMLRVLEADSIDGRLYEISDGFSFHTVVGAEDVVGGRIAWTAEDMWAALENMPEGCAAMPYGKEQLLREMLMTFWDRLVDRKKGTCDFDGEEFRQVLEFCGRFPEKGLTYSEQGEMLRDRELMLQCLSPDSFWALQEIRSDFRESISLVGLPNPWGETGTSFSLSGGLAMSSGGKNKEGAWAFLRTMLLPHKQLRFERRFPINKESFEESAARDGNLSGGRRYGYSDSAGNFHAYRQVSQKEYDQVMALYEAVDSVYRWDDSLGEIIIEIAGAYFAGDKTLDETAALIQNRANLYINEQK
ncbi:MAG: extracellular solute-binding protein [Oscillibacter sp.]|nr:extracellular solute-binding protein [Oscillibacter sp.]